MAFKTFNSPLFRNIIPLYNLRIETLGGSKKITHALIRQFMADVMAEERRLRQTGTLPAAHMVTSLNQSDIQTVQVKNQSSVLSSFLSADQNSIECVTTCAIAVRNR